MNLLPIIDWSQLGAAEREAALARPAESDDSTLRAEVSRLIDQVRADGDATLRALTRRFDGVELDSLQVSPAEFAAAHDHVSAALKQAIGQAYERIRRFHDYTKPQPTALPGSDGVVLERLVLPIDRVGLYVPAGSAPLPSTALMLGVPAQIAGCAQVVLCSPPRADGSVDPAVLYAAQLCGITQVFKLGGVQAIAAMAYGSASVPRCDKLFGPGNRYVMLAKQLVASAHRGPAIDMPAGPSEVMVIADASADPEIVAADLLSQAEHGPDSQVLLVSNDRAVLDAVRAALPRQIAALPRANTMRAAMAHARLIHVDDLAQAVDIANHYASEHLILNVAEPRHWLSMVRSAGSVFLGPYSAETLGDYNAGTNHCLPTDGHARAYSGVSVLSFVKLVTVQEVSAAGLAEIGPGAVTIAQAEGLGAHAQAVLLRLSRTAEASA